MPSEPLIALALSLLISLAPFLPAAEKSAPEEEPAPAVEEQPALSAEQLAALAQTPASWFDEPALLDALSKLPHYDETRAQRYLAYRTGGAWTLEQVLRIVNTDNDLPRFTAAVDADPDDGDLILVNKYSRLASDYVPDQGRREPNDGFVLFKRGQAYRLRRHDFFSRGEVSRQESRSERQFRQFGHSADSENRGRGPGYGGRYHDEPRGGIRQRRPRREQTIRKMELRTRRRVFDMPDALRRRDGHQFLRRQSR